MIPTSAPRKPQLLQDIEAIPGFAWEDLGIGDLKIGQIKDSFRFGEDQVVLAHWAADLMSARLRLKSSRGERPLMVADMGAGNGILLLLLSQIIPGSKGMGIELMDRPYKLLQANLLVNRLNTRFLPVQADLEDLAKQPWPNWALPDGTALGPNLFDLVVCNPPYFLTGKGPVRSEKTPGDMERLAAREERFASLETFLLNIKKALGPGGKAAILHRPDRLRDVLWAAKEVGLYPVRLRAITARAGERAGNFLLCLQKDPTDQFVWERDLVIRRPDGSYTLEVSAYYPEEEARDEL